LRPKFFDIVALTTDLKPMKKTLRPKKIADTIMTVGPCEGAATGVVDVVVDISNASLLYSYTNTKNDNNRNEDNK